VSSWDRELDMMANCNEGMPAQCQKPQFEVGFIINLHSNIVTDIILLIV
jgi:hypothetical protein